MGDCENGLGMKKLNKNFTYIGYHLGGYRHGLTITFNNSLDNKTIAIFMSSRSKSVDPIMFVKADINNLKAIKLASIELRMIKSYEQAYKLNLKEKRHQIYTGEKGWSNVGRRNFTMTNTRTNSPTTYKLKFNSTSNPDKVNVEFDPDNSKYGANFYYETKKDWVINVTSVRDNNIKVQWTPDGLTIENQNHSKPTQKIFIRNIFSFPKEIRDAHYLVKNTDSINYFHQLQKR